MTKYTHKTRDGNYLARILATDIEGEFYTVAVAVKDARHPQYWGASRSLYRSAQV